MAAKLKKKETKASKGAAAAEIIRYFLEYLSIFLGALIVLILPLALKNGYYKVGDFKFQVYAWLMAGGIVVLLPLAVLYLILGWKGFEKGFYYKNLSVTDKFAAAYMLLTLLSFFTNPAYMKANLLGYSGWYMGLYAQFTFIFLYFIMSRFAKDYRIVVALLVCSSFLAYIFGILHRLLIDPIHTYDGLDPQYYTFLSTLGQNSWYSGFLCSFLPFMMGLYMITKKTLLRILSGIFCLAGFITLISQNTDSAYFAMVGCFMVLLFLSVSSGTYMCRFLELSLGLFLGGKLNQLFLHLHANQYLRLDTISNYLIYGKSVWLILGALFLLWLVVFFLEKKEKYPVRLAKGIRNTLYILAVLFVIASATILYLGAHGIFTKAQLDSLGKLPYLTWYDNWGNGRGFTWSVSFKMIKELPFLKFLLGVGPDGFARYGYENYAELIRSKWGENVLTNAHNEWMTMFVNGGLFGLVTYMGIFLSLLTRILKRCKENPYLIVFAACIGSYMMHNMFCYQDVLCTPFLFLLMAFGEWEFRSMKCKNQTQN